MNKKIKKAWIQALLNGKYIQGKGKLKNKVDKTYCCLGVLASISPWKNTYTTMIDDGQNKNCLLPEKIFKWAKLPNSSCTIENEQSLSYKNDNGMTFKEIAKFIEDKL